MGFFSKLIKELSRPSKQTVAEFNRVVSKTVEETKRIDKQFKSVIGLGKPEFPDLPALDKVSPPTTRISGQASDEIRRRQRGKVSGRKDTIVTGELSPARVGKVKLLGRTSKNA